MNFEVFLQKVKKAKKIYGLCLQCNDTAIHNNKKMVQNGILGGLIEMKTNYNQ